jgi:hypothetical protein
VDVQSHGQKIDGKNMMHCKRLLEMAMEIGQGKGIVVRRPNADELLTIRRGEVDLASLLEDAEKKIKELDSIFENSSLPETIDQELVHSILVEIRKKFYQK